MEPIPSRLVVQSALELMALPRFGRFTVDAGASGMPRSAQAPLTQFGDGWVERAEAEAGPPAPVGTVSPAG